MGKHDGFNPKTGLIDAGSITNYRSTYNHYIANHGDSSNAKPHMDEHIETLINETVYVQKKKKKRDMICVALSTAAGTMVPYSGIPIMVATTMVQCVGFSASLGLIPIANVRSLQDAHTLAKQLKATLEKASSSGITAALEAFILEALKQCGIDCWLWDEILTDTVHEITAGVVTEGAWLLTPLFLAPKYCLHRKLIKQMYVSLGKKAIVVHKAWVNDHLILRKADPPPYPAGYGTTAHSQQQYESNSTTSQNYIQSESATAGFSGQQSLFPSPYPYAAQNTQQTMSYTQHPPDYNCHYQQ
ncbi:hypothetical protein Mapa_005819 [Marchantia paleacea]|nr:hypothetical protein Mapa_005819 [Marchantia paleacea]